MNKAAIKVIIFFLNMQYKLKKSPRSLNWPQHEIILLTDKQKCEYEKSFVYISTQFHPKLNKRLFDKIYTGDHRKVWILTLEFPVYSVDLSLKLREDSLLNHADHCYLGPALSN